MQSGPNLSWAHTTENVFRHCGSIINVWVEINCYLPKDRKITSFSYFSTFLTVTLTKCKNVEIHVHGCL